MPGQSSTGRSDRALTFEAFGVRVRILASDPEDLERVRRCLPPGSEPCPPGEPVATFELRARESSTYELSRDGETLARELEPELALEMLERELRALVAFRAPAHIFVHAGVVGYGGAALLVPGSSHSGKTSLVAALVRAGAEYYSDEYGPLDADGLVHPFDKPLSIRNEHFQQVDHHVEVLGGIAGEMPLPVGAVVVTNYEPGALWRPRRISSGEAVLALLSHTVPAQSRPAQALRTIGRALERAAVIEGTRGEADTVVPYLLAEVVQAR